MKYTCPRCSFSTYNYKALESHVRIHIQEDEQKQNEKLAEKLLIALRESGFVPNEPDNEWFIVQLLTRVINEHKN